MRTQWLLRGKAVESLDALPELSSPEHILAVDVLNSASGPAYFFGADAFAVLGLRLLNLTLQHGNSRVSAYSYGIYGMVAGSVLGNYEAGQKFADLAGRMQERYGNRELDAKLGLIRGGLIGHWRHPIREVYPLLLDGYKQGRVSGDLLYTGYCTNALLYCMVVAGEPLAEVEREASRYLEFQTRTKDFDASRTFVVEQRMVRHLQGRTNGTDSFGSDDFDEAEFVATLESLVMKIPLYLYRVLKLKACWLFGHWEQALELGDAAAEVAEAGAGLAFSCEEPLYHALNILTCADRLPAGERRKRLRQAAAAIKKVKTWARHSPSTHAHRAELLDAEQARRRGDAAAAMAHYDAAIEGARQHGFPQDEAIACERAGRFHAEAGRSRVARFFLMEAVHAYDRWGASAKVGQLQREFPEVRRSEPRASSTLPAGGSASTSGAALDFRTVVRAMQTISGEMVLDRLLALMMQIVLENAGAQRAVLLLRDGDALRVQARGPNPDGGFTVLQGAVPAPDELPLSLITYVERTGQSRVLQDAGAADEHAADPYIVNTAPKSVLCTPVSYGGGGVGVLYLENNLQHGAFTRERLETIGLLTSQIAISLENAMLYDQQKEMATAAARFVPTQFLQLLGRESLQGVGLGDSVEREITILFSDIRSFTTLSEAMSPEDNFAFLNRFLGGVGPVIRRHRGFIDKYIGDAVMALFPEEPADALHAAVAMQRFVAWFNARRVERAEEPISVGIGLHAGRVMLGTIGEAERLEGTVISDAVNIASRLEGLTKAFGVDVIVSGPMLEGVRNPSRFAHRFLGEVRLRGRQQGIELFEIHEHQSDAVQALRRATREGFEAAVRATLDQRWADAIAGFEAVLASDPSDSAARYHLSLAEGHERAGESVGLATG